MTSTRFSSRVYASFRSLASSSSSSFSSAYSRSLRVFSTTSSSTLSNNQDNSPSDQVPISSTANLEPNRRTPSSVADSLKDAYGGLKRTAQTVVSTGKGAVQSGKHMMSMMNKTLIWIRKWRGKLTSNSY